MQARQFPRSTMMRLGKPTLAFATIVATLALSAIDARANLVGHWKFDETSDSSTNNFGTRADSGPNGLTLSLTGSSYSRGDVGLANNALLTRRDEAFDTADNQDTTRLLSSDHAALDVSSFSFSIFVDPYVDDVKVSLFGRRDAWGVELVNDGSTGNVPKFNFYVVGTGAVDIKSDEIPFEPFNDEGGGSGDGTNNIVNWYHLAGSYDAGTGQIILYVDGTAFTNTNATVGSPANNSNGIYVGSVGFLPGMLGLYDDLQIYDRVLTPGEIAFLGANPGAIIPVPAALPTGLAVLGLIAVRRRR